MSHGWQPEYEGIVKLFIHSPRQIQGVLQGSVFNLESWVLIWSVTETDCQALSGATACSDNAAWYGQEKKKKLWVNIAVSKSFKSFVCLCVPVSISLSRLRSTSYLYENNKERYSFIRKCHADSFIFIMVHPSSLWWYTTPCVFI